MKDFIKMTLAVICGIVILGILFFVLCIGTISTLAVAGSSQTVIPKQAVLKIDMSEIMLAEQSSETDPMAAIKGDNSSVIGLWDAIRALDVAAEDPSIQYIYLRPEAVANGMSEIYEFRQALNRFRQSGKPIISYMDNVNNSGYYLASVSDKIYLTSHEGGIVMLNGICGQMFFLKDILDKLGVNVQLIRHGKYKSAGEMFVRNSSSPENMEQNQAMISSMWSQVALEMANCRMISVERLNDLIDNLKLNSPEDFLNANLVDGLMTAEELKCKLADLASVEKFKDVKMVSFSDYIGAKVKAATGIKQKIAVIYADGEIVDGFDRKEVAGDYLASQIAKVRADSTVKAVVFRVNSPGGSVLASEKIKNEIELLGEQKPVVASYGAYAASGGYWISSGCPHIFATPLTLTGSIGVFSMIPDISGTLKDIAHVTFTPVKSNRHADMYTLMRPLDSDETAYMQESVENIYGRFVSLVSEGRNLTPEFVDSVAQGRVWTGKEALDIHLVDELGTLDDAIKYAAEAASDSIDGADLSLWNVVGYPKPQTTMEMVMEMFGKTTEENVLSGTPLESVSKALVNWASSIKDGRKEMTVARMPFDIVWNN